MTKDDQKKCSELWEMASGDLIAPRDWTDNAGDELTKFFAGVHGCSEAVACVPSPSGSAPGYGWVVTHVYNVLKNKYNLNNRLVFKCCSLQSIRNFKSTIPSLCLG